MDDICSLVFIIVSILALSRAESPSALHWILTAGYSLRCVPHIGRLCIELWRRRPFVEGNGSGSPRMSSGHGPPPNLEVDEIYAEEHGQYTETARITKLLESICKIWPFLQWTFRFFWQSGGGQDWTRDAPLLDRLCIVLSAFYMFLLVFRVALACLLGIAVRCCFPSTIGDSYAMPDENGATDEDIQLLPRYKFTAGVDAGAGEGPLGGVMTESGGGGGAPTTERFLLPEDASCSVCLFAYDDGAELRRLPCGHHFHGACIGQWLLKTATCPLCRRMLAKGGGAATRCRDL